VSKPLRLIQTEVIVPPLDVEVEGVKFTVVEVLGYTTVANQKRYIVSLYAESQGYRSQLFRLDVSDSQDLVRKLRVEASKMHLMLASGYTQLFSKAQ